MYGGSLTRCVAYHERDRRFRVLKSYVFVYILGVGTARGLFITTNVSGLTNVYDVIFHFSLPDG